MPSRPHRRAAVAASGHYHAQPGGLLCMAAVAARAQRWLRHLGGGGGGPAGKACAVMQARGRQSLVRACCEPSGCLAALPPIPAAGEAHSGELCGGEGGAAAAVRRPRRCQLGSLLQGKQVDDICAGAGQQQPPWASTLGAAAAAGSQHGLRRQQPAVAAGGWHAWLEPPAARAAYDPAAACACFPARP